MATLAPSPPASSAPSSASAVAADARSSPPAPAAPQVRRWTVDEFEAMIDAGIFHPDERLELIHGQLCTMSPQSDSHFDTVTLVAAALREHAPNTMHVREQGPLHLEDGSRPEPDVMLVPGTIQEYNGGRTNRPSLVVEVAVSSLAYDRSTKADLYARHGLPEYWIVDLQHRTVEVYTDPGPDVYRTKRTAEPGDTLTPECAPNAQIAVDALLPSAEPDPPASDEGAGDA